MIERLRRALDHVEELPPEVQERLAEFIEGHLEARRSAPPRMGRAGKRRGQPKSVRDALSLAGAWADMPGTLDEMIDELDRIRHASKPTPPMDEQLGWLLEDEDGEE